MANSAIRYLTHDEIDPAKWDQCIAAAGNGLIYGYAAYLDGMATQWDALVYGDYEVVMPLPWRRKYGIRYIYQPFLAAQLGIFGNAVDAQQVANFLRAIPSQFRYIDSCLNQQNNFPVAGFEWQERMNYKLHLLPSYETLRSSYRETIIRNLKKAEKAGCFISSATKLEEVIALARLQPQLSAREADEGFSQFANVYGKLAAAGQARIYGIRSAKNELLASAVFLYSHHRAFYLLVGNHPNGRTIGASHALIDAFIRDHAGKDLWLDFEGSDLRNLAFFYSSFGAVGEKYPAIRANRLPRLLRWLKS